ncbi:hypothetical protein PsYK624_030690 [Phanerochaete sordida]|uniref:Uncharacterized protein n=1 Tax=Phanerochaete sordida TaxID=48140 RepID=A0A9P3G2E2_9APHY|nr:hypothetical protein PsYK624_030690 [Phanerochaete sordida]
MLRLRTLVIGTALAALPALYIRSRILSLEREYPPLPLESTSTPELRTPRAPGLRTDPGDVYATRVPLSALRRLTRVGAGEASLEDAWARAFFQSRTIGLEATLLGIGSKGNRGEHGFRRGESVMANAMLILREPAPGTPMLIEWATPSSLMQLSETFAAWGWPYKLMNGGRQEWSIGPVTRLPGDDEDMVEIRYGTAQDFRVVEGEKEPGKSVSPWMLRGHRAYARYLLDATAKEISGKDA